MWLSDWSNGVSIEGDAGEHEAIGAVLNSLDRAVDALAQGRRVDSTIFQDVLRFTRLFVGKCPHGKEGQILFPRVRHTSSTTDTVIAQLEKEHAQGTALADAFAQAVAGYTEEGSHSDLVAALAPFERFEAEVMGTGTHEELHRMSDTLEARIEAYTA